MYIASIIAVHRSNHTCNVTFVDDDETFTLPINHLRHVTLEDIQLNRCVDYGMGWTEQTQFGTIIKYDRYGEQQCLQYCEPFLNSFDHIETSASYNINAQETPCSHLLLNRGISTLDCTQSSVNEPIWVRIPHPEDPTATYSRCPIWNAKSYADAEKQALGLCNDDIHYREALQRAERQLAPFEPLIPLYFYSEDSNEWKLPERTLSIDVQTLQSAPPRSDSLSPTTRALTTSVDPSLALTNSSDKQLPPTISMPIVTRLPAMKAHGVRTDSLTSLAVTDCSSLNKQGLCAASKKSKEFHRTPPSDSKKVTNSHSLKHHRSIFTKCLSRLVPTIDRQLMYWLNSRFYRSYFYGFSTNLTLILLVLLLSYQLLIGSSFCGRDIPHVSTATTRTINIGATGALTTAIFICGMPPLSLMSNGPSKSLFERWPYPFTTP